MKNDDKDFWLRLNELGDGKHPEELKEFLQALLPEEIARTFGQLGWEKNVELIEKLDAETAAGVLEDLRESQVADIVEELSAGVAAGIVEELSEETQRGVLREVSGDASEAILAEMEPVQPEELRKRIDYPDECAGALMSGHYLTYRESDSVGGVLRDMEDNAGRYSDYHVQYVYITDAKGVLLRSAVLAARARRAPRTFLKLSGIIGGEELRSLPTTTRGLRRLAFLAPNIALNLIAASVIALYQDTLQAVIVLAVFLPIIPDMSGCSGNQAVAVSIRELALGVIAPGDFWRIVWKEGGHRGGRAEDLASSHQAALMRRIT